MGNVNLRRNGVLINQLVLYRLGTTFKEGGIYQIVRGMLDNENLWINKEVYLKVGKLNQ